MSDQRFAVSPSRSRLAICLLATLVLLIVQLRTPPAAWADTAQFSMSPSGGVAGLDPALRSVDSCPTGPGDRGVLIESAVIPTSPAPRPDDNVWTVASDGSWNMAMDVSLTAAPGEYEVNASCVLWGEGFDYTITQRYVPMTWTVTAPAQPPSLSSNRAGAHGNFTVRGSCPDAGNGVNVRLVDPSGSYFPGGGLETIGSRSWSVVVGVDSAEAPAGRYSVQARCTDPGISLENPPAALPTLTYLPAVVDVLPQVSFSLGDSYSSGEANAPFDAGTNIPPRDWTNTVNMCHRSSSAWPRLIGVPKTNHFACSGAVISDLTSGGPNDSPDDVGQIARLRDASRRLAQTGQAPDIVTLTIGGNDIGFKDILKSCYVGIGCLNKIDQDIARVNKQTARITAALVTIRQFAPRAQIYLVGYPRIFPTKPASNTACRTWLSATEMGRLAKLSAAIEKMQETATANAGPSLDTYNPQGPFGFKYISVSSALSGHELCTSNSWVFPIASFSAPYYDQRQAHPLVPGQQAIAKVVDAEISRHLYTE